MNFHLNTHYGSKIELYRIRLIARLCVAIVFLVQFFSRMITISGIINSIGGTRTLAIIGYTFAPVLALTVAIEYFLFKKKGPRALKHSQIFDVIILLLFIGDWIIASLVFLAFAPPGMNPELFPIQTVYGFTTFGWRTLLVILIVHKWGLKIIGPIAAIITMTVLTIHYDSKYFYFTLIRSAVQIFFIVFIIYCEDKIKWMMIWNNIQQEKWMQINNFILNNIPENIMILDIKGEARFISDYCKSFIEKYHLSLDTRDLFNKIRDLQQQKESEPASPNHQTENLPMQVARLTTDDAILAEAVNQNNENWLKVGVLTELITNFKVVIAEKPLQEKQFLIYNGKLRMENHQDRSIEVKISFIRQLENEYIILILRDTTQRDLLITLEETNKYKDQLLASVSHELRTPLNGNINLVEAAINSKKVPENIKETLLVPALRSSKFLLHLINDILDMSQIKEKKLRLVFQSGSLFETLKSTAQLVELQAKKKGIELFLNLDPQLPRNFSTDHVRVSQIILNLLNNALKFTKQGSVKLIAETMFPKSNWVKITIEDSGIGMSPENVKKLFSSYTHIEFEGRQEINPTGVGLGLNIAFNLVQLLAPKDHQIIDVQSVPNQGSTFSFILENQQREPPAQLNKSEDIDLSDKSCVVVNELPDNRKPKLSSQLHTLQTLGSSILLPDKIEFEPLLLESCSCPKFLIVDDNPFNTMAFETILTSLNMKCDSVYSGSSAIEKLLQRENKKCCKDCKPYSVVFMDQEMPEMDGIDTTKEIRNLQKENLLSQDTKIIGCTAHQSEGEVNKFIEAGLDNCIHKPISATMIADFV